MSRQLWVDMDGVLADFDTGYHAAFGGIKPSRTLQDHALDPVEWDKVNAFPNFFEHLPAMPGMRTLWAHIRRYHPVILTGVPPEVPAAVDHKMAWVERYLGKHVPVVGCRSREKYTFCKPGDILIDDWTKYMSLWRRAGGIWITHTSADETISILNSIGVS